MLVHELSNFSVLEMAVRICLKGREEERHCDRERERACVAQCVKVWEK